MIELQHLRECLRYYSTTGRIVWLERPLWHFKSAQAWKAWNTKYTGTNAGVVCSRSGYVKITIDYKHYAAHVLAWFLYYGVWPDTNLDHRNHDRSDNRIRNLRKATHAENSKNMKRSVANTSGATGVVWDKRTEKWRARIHVNGKDKHIGYFFTVAAAAKARKAAEKKYGYHRNHGVQT